jgi:small-conductance mechanosensitive channel
MGWIVDMDGLTFDLWARLLGAVLGVALVALLAYRLLRPVLRRVVRFSTVLGTVLAQCERPLAFLLPLAATMLVWQSVPDEMPGVGTVAHLNGVLLIGVITWLAVAAVQGVADGVVALHPATVADNLAARRIQTQTRVLSRTAAGAVLLAGLAFMLMTFPRARQLGASLLASAGVVGLVAGIAARSVFSNLLAGLHIAMAQPLRLDDVLIIEGEWGRVEEITATYVVLKIWDERRLIVPLQWFTDHPFQNWTRSSAQLLGTVFLWVDYTLPVAPIRAETQRLCEASKDWDGRVCGVQVTEADERGMQLRILVSSASSGQNFDLRCTVREGLIDFIQREYPTALPRTRAELDGLPDMGRGTEGPERPPQPPQQPPQQPPPLVPGEAGLRA